MTIAAMEPTESNPGTQTPDYGQIYTLLSRVMREQPLPNLSPLDARVILDLLTDLERRLAVHDVSNQINFVISKYREIMETTSAEVQPSSIQTKTGQGSSNPSNRPRTQLSSLNPLNVPVELLNLKKRTSYNLSSHHPFPESAKDKQKEPPQSTPK
ncbi:uncharacterized protein LOC114953979 [Acropora millepora]|uniref:uncharacterized protein LOC114953979 n=1 Tax=Acropora millepora TaxID=45264 RepID=UPI001CF0E28A|nr:uncharacterized protein LOC114953979 [Acropora millepora]